MAELGQFHESFGTGHASAGGSNRQFGLVIAAIFAVAWLLPLLGDTRSVRGWAFVPMSAFLATALVAPRLLAPLNRLWTKLGLLLARLINPLVLGAVFFAVVTPTALLMRLARKDLLRLRIDPSLRTYWIERPRAAPGRETMRDQF